ncbi:pentatricopeptide repeat-containing protein At2g27800, mitochondrial [Magnolia sinica]|uniref:pentatricopeptide repeat-containing protein At2g27800, mitochondrial n=1 Tax=Magnolia sinica TaxID=86752 RepID=UPI00265B1E63|nr:pentatricopeptide repeat-containing protein At2g27800, mitochondrial [Magnolia sinica]
MIRILRRNHFILSNDLPCLLSSYSSLPYPTATNTPPKFRIPKPKSKSPPSPPPSSPQLHHLLSQLPPRFTTQDLSKTISLQKDPHLCLHLFNWASQQPRFRHDLSTFLITVKKLGSAKLYEDLDAVVDQALAIPIPSSETLFNTIIYFYTEGRKLSRAVTVFKHMKKSKDPNSHPSIRTYNLLFSAMLSRGSNSYINHMYMETIRCLFRQMVDDGIEPDIFCLNSMIKGYVLSLHLNDALRVFHQMGVVYKCLPNGFSYDYLIHGLCAQGRSRNAMEFYGEMKSKGFVPSGRAYNSLVNCLAISGEVDEAVRILWEMGEKGRLADWITYKTVLDSIGRQGRVRDAISLLKELQDKDMVDGHTYRKLLYFLEDDFGNSDGRNGMNRS